jgi:hypothetical protein
MTEKYYCDNVLPIYIAAIHEGRLKRPGNWLLQEDNDSSHGTRSNNLAAELRAQNWINTLVHPAQSPDLNPIEAIWNIIKQRLRKMEWRTVDECKKVLEQLWAEIDQMEIQKRISEMPWRCTQLVEHDGGPIRSNLW